MSIQFSHTQTLGTHAQTLNTCIKIMSMFHFSHTNSTGLAHTNSWDTHNNYWDIFRISDAYTHTHARTHTRTCTQIMSMFHFSHTQTLGTHTNS